MSIVIKVEDISKQYRLGKVGTGTLSHDLNRWWHRVRGKEDPFLKIGEINDRTVRGSSEYVWALRGVNFEIPQGEAVGIIGRNGAGKSTLLKILSRTTAPTTGNAKIKGRVASLLEVGTGFHPELSGRDNIYLNGAILGMTRKEITQKFDEIVDFSGVERYIDTPVKRYSSGMYVRLAFAVAAHLESEILIVDEVLAVGDAEFQKKCLGKMGEVSQGEGRTVLFVSHNLASIKELCQKSILLNMGSIEEIGSTNSIVRKYLHKPIMLRSETDLVNDTKSRRGAGEARFIDIAIDKKSTYQDPQKEIRIDIKIKIIHDINDLFFSLLLRSPDSPTPIINSGTRCISASPLKKGQIISFVFTIPPNTLRTGLFPIYFWIGSVKEFGDNYPYDVVDGVFFLNVDSNSGKAELGYSSVEPVGYMNLPYSLDNINFS
jgi:ABC-type polysaccharide/polyol phosphate transport system ATPase subunit